MGFEGESARGRGRAEATTLGDVVRLFVRRRWTVLGTAALVVAVALGLAFWTRPKFEAHTTIVLDAGLPRALLGDLAPIASLAGADAAASEISLLRSRTVASLTALEPDGEAEDAARRLGLTTLVHDEGLTTLGLFLARLRGEGRGERAPVQPPGRLHARAERASTDAPSRVRVEVLEAGRVRVSTAGALEDLGLADAHPEEHALVPGEPLRYRGLALALAPEGEVVGRSFLVEHLPRYEAVDRLLERYWAAEIVRGSGVVRLTVTDTDPFRAAETANALAANYLDLARAKERRRSSATSEYVEELLGRSFDAIEDAQRRLLEVQSERPETIDVQAAAGALIDRLSALEVQRLEADLRARELREIVQALAAGDARALGRLDGAITGGLFADPQTEALLARIAGLEAHVAELLQTCAAAHPDVVAARGAVAELHAKVRAQLEARLAAYDERAGEVAAAIADVQGELARLPDGIRALADPTLDLQVHTELVPALLKALHAVRIGDRSTEFQAEVVDPAVPATEVASPLVAPLAALAALLGLLLGAVVAFATDGARGRVHDAREIEAEAGLPVLAVVPDARGRAAAARRAETLRALAARTLALVDERGRSVVGVASAEPEASRAALVAALAEALAAQGLDVLLVDADLEAPSQHERHGLSLSPGLAEGVLGGGPWEELARPTARPGLALLPAGSGASSSEALGRARLAAVLARLRERHDVVLLDLPPLARSAGVDVVAPALDLLLLACRRGTTPRSAVARALARVRRAGGRVDGLVLSGGKGREAAA